MGHVMYSCDAAAITADIPSHLTSYINSKRNTFAYYIHIVLVYTIESRWDSYILEGKKA